MSNETRWTPGPWRIRDCPLKGAQTDRQDDGRIKLVDFNDGTYEGTLAIVQTEDSEANAHLIAAAPTMYKALEATNRELNSAIEKINEMLRDKITTSDLQPPDYWDQQTVYENEMLLAKARGEAK